MPEITAQLNYLRISPRKVRAVAEVIKGLDVDMARVRLNYIVRRPTKPLLKLLESAVANAQHNLGLDKNYLYIKDIIVNEGIKFKRYKPKGFGLAMPIQKKTSNIKIILDELSQEKKRKKEELLAKIPRTQVKPKEEIKEKVEEKLEEGRKIKVEPKPSVAKEVKRGAKKGVFGGIKSLGRRWFRRKSI